ncbi:MAG: MBL fold metallo-hydrolase [Syntrophomonadaceae bacterium]|nr:MBL fold metallo-hydrolase [Syntrophomonadaceae bacterium]
MDGMLVDTGPESRKEQFQKWFLSQNIQQVVLTHNHEDHSGNAAWIQQNLNVPIYLHPEAIFYAHEDGAYPKYRVKMWGHRSRFEPEPMPQNLYTNKYNFEVLDTPGHTIYHNSFYEPEQGWLFTGDLYLGTKLFVCFIEENIRQTISTLEMLMKLEFDTIFCAHAGVVENAKYKLGKKLNYLKELQEQVISMRKQGLTDREIDDKIHGFKLSITDISCGEWSSYNIVRTI